MIKKYVIMLLMALLVMPTVDAKNKKTEYRYEVVPVAVGAQGTYLIKVCKEQKECIRIG